MSERGKLALIGQFVSQGAVLRYLGARAPRPVAYGHGVPLLGTGDQRPRHDPHRAGAGPAARPRPGDRGVGWGASNQAVGFFAAVYRLHWPLTAAEAAVLQAYRDALPRVHARLEGA